MAFATLWIAEDDPVSWIVCGGNIRLQLGAAVVWMTPAQWEALTARPAHEEARLPQLREVVTPVRKLNPDVWSAAKARSAS